MWKEAIGFGSMLIGAALQEMPRSVLFSLVAIALAALIGFTSALAKKTWQSPRRR